MQAYYLTSYSSHASIANLVVRFGRNEVLVNSITSLDAIILGFLDSIIVDISLDRPSDCR